MKEKKLRPYMLTMVYLLIVAAFLFSTYILTISLSNAFDLENETKYVSDIMMDTSIPAVASEEIIKRPYESTEVTIAKSYYDYQKEAKEQEKSIIIYENTYMQNSGVDYVSKNSFDVIAILDGTVTSIDDDELLGKTIKIKHNNDMISVYQSISDVNVEVNQQVTQGFKVGVSGKNTLNGDNQCLHFELVYKSKIVNPEEYYDKTIKEL